MNDEAAILGLAREVFRLESEAVAGLSSRIDGNFVRAVSCILECRGRVVVTGVGKSGHIGRKVASTLASTGTPSLFLHAAEALHGDLGMVTTGDVLLAISYSGRSDELTGLLPNIRNLEVPIVALTGNAQAYLAAHATIVLDIEVEREACPLNLAPTSSTAAALAMGDALAVCVMQLRGFGTEAFARTHPAGALGKTSTLRVQELMRTGARLARVSPNFSVRQTLQSITEAQAGAAVVTDDSTTSASTCGVLLGYVTDGDVRRQLLGCDNAETFLRGSVEDIMTRTPLSLSPQMLAIDSLRALQDRGVDDAPVVDEANGVVGVLDIQELLRAGVM